MPALGSSGVPRLGTTFSVTLAGARANAAALHSLGRSNTAWGGVPLPFDLTTLGAPACAILASGELMSAVPTNTGGTAAVPYPVPNDAALLGSAFYNQFVVSDPPANPLGLVTSNGGRGVVGNL